MHRERNRIDRMIGHLKINGAFATRSDKLARSFLDALHIAAIRRYLRYATLQTGLMRLAEPIAGPITAHPADLTRHSLGPWPTMR